MEQTRNSDYFLQVLKAAAPYVGAQARAPIQVLIQAGELSYQLRHMPEEAELSAYDLEDDRADIENLLVHVQEVATPRERESIQTMLNFVRAGKMMQSYQRFMQTRPPFSAQEGSSSMMMDFLLSQLSPEQRSNLDMLRSVMEMQNLTETEGGGAGGNGELA